MLTMQFYLYKWIEDISAEYQYIKCESEYAAITVKWKW